MLQRMFGRSRQPSSVLHEQQEGEDDYVVIGGAQPPNPDVSYTLEGASAFHGLGDSRRGSTVTRSASTEDPVDGVPFKLTVDVSADLGSDLLSEALAMVARMESTDWDAYEYDFRLEQSVLDECNRPRIQTVQQTAHKPHESYELSPTDTRVDWLLSL